MWYHFGYFKPTEDNSTFSPPQKQRSNRVNLFNDFFVCLLNKVPLYPVELHRSALSHRFAYGKYLFSVSFRRFALVNCVY